MKVMSESVFNSIIEFIDEYYFANNTVPTMQEIADAIKLNKSNVSRNLQAMKERGLIETTGGWRGIRTKKMSKVLADTVAALLAAPLCSRKKILRVISRFLLPYSAPASSLHFTLVATV